MNNEWYKNAIIYGIEIETFADGNGDGVGDMIGLTQKLDYLHKLGVTCLWLMPFYPSPERDDGYDVTDYCAIDPRLGTFDDFTVLMEEAHKRDMNVVVDLVVHHTSDEHPWFQEAQSNPNSVYRDYYIWTSKIPDYPQPQPGFPGVESSVWRFNGYAKQYYYHSFYNFEPDLNICNPNVQKEILKIMEFWLSQGVDGFRIDAATMMFDRKGLKGTEVTNGDEIMEQWHELVQQRNPRGILLAEADVPAPKVKEFFGQGNRMQLLYNFLLNRYIFLSMATSDAKYLKDEYRKVPVPPPSCQWMNFLRNQDELNIGQLSESEKQAVYDAFAPDEYMKAYGRGIRRRMAPMLRGDPAALKMAFSLLFSLPGAHMIYYGEEIGMGDNLQLPQRLSVRTPMQWNNSKNAGFSDVNPLGMIRKVIDWGQFSYKDVNAENELRYDDSLLNTVRALIAIRRKNPQLGNGVYSFLDVHPPEVFASVYDYKGEVTIILVNLSEHSCTVKIDEYKNACLEQFFADGKYNQTEDPQSIEMHGYGFRWLKVRRRE